MKSINNVILILLVSLLGTISSFSQTTYPKVTPDSLIVITPKQLKQTNLIFLEHQKVLKENILLNDQITNLELINANLVNVDSLRTLQVERSMLQAKLSDQAISSLNNQIKKKNKTIGKLQKLSVGGITVSIGLLAFILLK